MVFDDEAVLDRETGLVWQKNTSEASFNWNDVQNACYAMEIGGRFGWRLPTIYELATLLDSTQESGLPDGHPFTNVQLWYWSSTENTGVEGGFEINFSDGLIRPEVKTIGRSILAVRAMK